MVDIERKWITLSDWTKWISVDEYAWGSYYYSENIQSDYCTKWFKLWKYASAETLNGRNSGHAVAISPIKDWGILWDIMCFEDDWRIETNWHCSGIWYYDWDEDLGWALYARRDSLGYVNWLIYWDYAIWITRSKVDRIKYDFPYMYDEELVANPILKSPWTSWTIWEWRTINWNWAQHTTWNTWALTCNITIPEAWKYRVAICVRWVTEGRVSITGVGYNMRTENGKYWRFVFNSWEINAWATTLTITPSSTFDWYVEIVNVHEFSEGNIDADIATITSANQHPICLWQGDLYIWSWNKIDILNLTYYDVETKSIIDRTYTIVDITQQAGNLIIWATDWFNSKQYYWNWVDATASEVIEWDWLSIKWVASTETVSYVLTLDNGIYRVYAVNWYQRSLLSISQPTLSTNSLLRTAYKKDKKFVMNRVDSPNSMDVIWDSLYIPWCMWLYKYGSEVPWMNKIWNRIYVNKMDLTHIVLWNWAWWVYMAYTRNGWNDLMHFSSTQYGYSGYLVTNPIYWDKIWTRKSIEKLKIWYRNGASSASNVAVNIKIYAIVDDDYFWRFNVTWVTNRPEIWDIYRVASQTNAKIIDIKKTSNSEWVITLATIERRSQSVAGQRITKISWSWDTYIDSNYENDNMFLIKEITNENAWYYSDFIFGENFVDSYMPYWHKIQFVIELYSDSSSQTPEVYELSMTADIADTTI